jgi:hypothetical protein
VDETATHAPPPPYPVDSLGKFFTPVAIAAAAVDEYADGAVQPM